MCRCCRAVRVRRCGGSIDVSTVPGNIVAVAVLVGGLLMGGCHVAQSEPPPERPFGEVESEERGVVAAVYDTTMDLRTGQSRPLQTSLPTVPLGPLAVAVPVTIGGEKRRDVPAEEITVRLPTGKLVLVIQAQGHPAFAVGEQVKILHERPHYISGESRQRVVRVE